MPNPKKVFQKDINAKNFNYLWFGLLFIAFVGSLFQQWNGVKAGLIYTTMFVGFTALLFIVFLLIKNDDTVKPISSYVRFPLATSQSLASLMYISGLIAPFIINMFTRILGSFSVTSFSIPLFSAGKAQDVVSFSVAQFEESMGWKIFNIFFVAGTIETFVYNFGLMIFGAFIGIMIAKLISKGKKVGFMKKSTFVMLVALFTSISFFIISHVMNGTYTTVAFIMAGGFLLLSNLSIYKAGVFLIFWAGYHQANNLLYLINQYGLVKVLEGFLSPFGLIFVGFIGIILFHLINYWSDVKKDFSDYWRS